MISSPVPVLACRPLESSGEFVYGGTPSYYDRQNLPDAHLPEEAKPRLLAKNPRRENITD